MTLSVDVATPKSPAKVGDAATMCYPQDLYPMVVTAVSPTGSKITLTRLNYMTPAEREAGHLTPDGNHNGFPVYDRTIGVATAPVDAERTETAYWSSANACYMIGGLTPVRLGVARYRRDWSD